MRSRFAEALRAKGEVVTERSGADTQWGGGSTEEHQGENRRGDLWMDKVELRHKVTLLLYANVAKAIEQKRWCFKVGN